MAAGRALLQHGLAQRGAGRGPPLTIFACTIPTEGPSLRFLQGWAAMLREKLGTDGTFTSLHSSKNWGSFRLSPGFPTATDVRLGPSWAAVSGQYFGID
jgi:hypothetical protein